MKHKVNIIPPVQSGFQGDIGHSLHMELSAKEERKDMGRWEFKNHTKGQDLKNIQKSSWEQVAIIAKDRKGSVEELAAEWSLTEEVALERWRGGEGQLHTSSGQQCSDALDIPLMLPIWEILLGQHDTSAFWTTTPTSALTSLAPLGWTSLQANVLILRQSAWIPVPLPSLPTLKQPLAQLPCC